MPERQQLKISAPGRVCLFGEHQDYLKLPVIPAAISLRLELEGSPRTDRTIHIDLPDIAGAITFSLDDTAYRLERDYFRSSINILKREGFTFSNGFDCRVHGNIPINSGASSSTALVTVWIRFLARMSDQQADLDPARNAQLAHRAEVVEFHEPGGQMDHYSIAFGGVIHLDFQPELSVKKLKAGLGAFVLGDSGEPKDTRGILARVKNQVLAVSAKLARQQPGFSLHQAIADDLRTGAGLMTHEQLTLLEGTLRNRDLTRAAQTLLANETFDEEELGRLLNEHQAVLRDALRISTPKIDAMLEAALEAGALGGKINGSGGGGCMFVYAPEKPEQVAGAIESVGGKAHIVQVDEGVTVELM